MAEERKKKIISTYIYIHTQRGGRGEGGKKMGQVGPFMSVFNCRF